MCRAVRGLLVLSMIVVEELCNAVVIIKPRRTAEKYDISPQKRKRYFRRCVLVEPMTVESAPIAAPVPDRSCHPHAKAAVEHVPNSVKRLKPWVGKGIVLIKTLRA